MILKIAIFLFSIVLFQLALLLSMEIYMKIADWWDNIFNGRID